MNLHTLFFINGVPSIKYRTNLPEFSQQDEDEERLCNIAASELLMPTSIFSKIVKDFSPSPQALKRISELFETSLTATLVKLQVLRLWDANFILWKFKNKKLEPEWLAGHSHGLSYKPKFELLNYNASGIYHTFLTGDDTSDFEWVSLNGGHKKRYFKSIQLNSNTVLSCFSNKPNSNFILTEKDKSDLSPLSSSYVCRCDGTGWYSIRKDGMRYAARCLALKAQGFSSVTT